MELTSCPGAVRQLIVTGPGRRAPTVIITNDHRITTRAAIGQYARRVTIEQRLAEIIRAFCADALCSAVNLNGDLGVVLYVLAHALAAALRRRLPGNYAHATATPSYAASWTPAARSATPPGITVKINRRAYLPILWEASLASAPPTPCWDGHELHFEFA
jgi:hypothetical protein